MTQTADRRPRKSFRENAVIVIWPLIALQAAVWLAILILDTSSIEVVVGSIGGNQLQMTLFWTGVGCVMVLIFGAEVSYARDHRGAGITIIVLTAIGTVVLAYAAMIAISVTAYQSFTHFSLEGSGDTYTIESTRPILGGGGPDITVYRTNGPFYDRNQHLADDRLSSYWNPFENREYFAMQKGSTVTIFYSPTI